MDIWQYELRYIEFINILDLVTISFTGSWLARTEIVSRSIVNSQTSCGQVVIFVAFQREDRSFESLHHQPNCPVFSLQTEDKSTSASLAICPDIMRWYKLFYIQ